MEGEQLPVAVWKRLNPDPQTLPNGQEVPANSRYVSNIVGSWAGTEISIIL